MEQQQQQQQQQQHQPIQKRETIHNAQYTSHTNNRGRKTDASKEGKKERRKEIEVEGKGSLQLTSNQLRWTGATIKVSDTTIPITRILTLIFRWFIHHYQGRTHRRKLNRANKQPNEPIRVFNQVWIIRENGRLHRKRLIATRAIQFNRIN